MKIGMIGFGVIGKALYHILKNKFEIFIYDKYQEGYKDLQNVVKNCEIFFVSLPTPMKQNREIDLEYIEDALSLLSKELEKNKKTGIVVLRSTIVPGTTELLQKKYSNMNLVFNPEFLTERNALKDMEETSRIVLGGEKEFVKKIEEIYKKVFPNADYIITNSRTAEMSKYASNATLAGQVMIANEIYQICQKLKIDYDIVKNSLLLDSKIGTNINVPGPDNDFGFGGKCLPKDLNAIICLSKSIGYNPELLEQIWNSNLKLRKNQNWKDIKGAVSENKFRSMD